MEKKAMMLVILLLFLVTVFAVVDNSFYDGTVAKNISFLYPYNQTVTRVFPRDAYFDWDYYNISGFNMPSGTYAPSYCGYDTFICYPAALAPYSLYGCPDNPSSCTEDCCLDFTGHEMVNNDITDAGYVTYSGNSYYGYKLLHSVNFTVPYTSEINASFKIRITTCSTGGVCRAGYSLRCVNQTDYAAVVITTVQTTNPSEDLSYDLNKTIFSDCVKNGYVQLVDYVWVQGSGSSPSYVYLYGLKVKQVGDSALHNASIDYDADGTYEFQHIGDYDSISNMTSNLSSNRNSQLSDTLCNCSSCTVVNGVNCSIDDTVYTSTAGYMQLKPYSEYFDGKPPFWEISNVNNSNPRINDTINFSVRLIDYTALDSAIFSHNCSSSLLWLNQTAHDLIGNNLSINFTLDINETANFSDCSCRILVNDSSGNMNYSIFYSLEVLKVKPNVSVTLQNKPIIGTDDLNCTITFDDLEGDTWIANETRWYNGSILVSDFNNSLNVSADFTNEGELWTCKARVNDTFNYSDWKNDTVIIGDSASPIIDRLFVSSSSVELADSVTFYANVTDALSVINPDACIFGFYKPDIAVSSFNSTTDVKNGDNISKTLTMSVYGTGTLEWLYSWCSDASGNTVYNSSIGINISIGILPTTPVGGGGGSAPEIEENCTWDIRTTYGRLGYAFYIPYKNAKPVKKELFLTNYGEELAEVRLSCEKADEEDIDICDYITFANDTLTVQPNIQNPSVDYFFADFPDEADINDQFSFNIVGEGENCRYIMSNKAIINRLSFSKWRYITSPKGEKIPYPAIIPAIFAWLMIFLIGIVISKSTNAFLGVFVIGMIGGASAFFFLLWL